MREEYQELADREWLSVIADDVVADIGRRRKKHDLDLMSPDTATNRITTKSGEIAEQLVTNVLRAQFSKEASPAWRSSCGRRSRATASRILE